ncbi:hypothetical protein C8R45DRAFT_1221575 [Mycena sanguinolenta]|nr:hypothetical protein C8R45DRAFT_1221575 [Mycena sanguinolenta]
MPVVQLRALQNVVVRARALEDARAFIYVAASSAGDCTGNKIINGALPTTSTIDESTSYTGVPLASSARYTTTNTPGSVHNTALDALCIRERREDPGSAASSTATATTAASLSICPLPGDPRLEDNVAKTVTKLLQSRRDDALRIGAMTDRRAPRIGTAVEEATTSNSTLASTSISTSRPVRPSCSAATNASTRACTAYPNGTAPYTQAVHPRFATYALTRHLARPRVPQPIDEDEDEDGHGHGHGDGDGDERYTKYQKQTLNGSGYHKDEDVAARAGVGPPHALRTDIDEGHYGSAPRSQPP